MRPTYFLAKHAHLCACEGDLILLDLKSGKYIGLNPTLSAPLASIVQGWPALPGQLGGQPVDENPSSAANLRTLLDKGLLTTTPELGKDAAPVCLAAPTNEINSYFAERPPPIRLAHVLTFLYVVLTAATLSRLVPLRRTVSRLAQLRKARARSHEPASLAQAAALTSVYNRLRLLTFSAKDHCFFDSMVLLEFLYRFGVFPSWIFGVQSSPFVAHCWIQHETTVLNDTAHGVGRFTPIMVV